MATFRTEFTLEIFPQRIQRLVDSPDGPVGQHVQKASRLVLEVAKSRVGRRWSGTTGKPKESRPGSLRDSGAVEHLSGAAYSVVFHHPIALIHHEGASSHVIPAGGQPNKTIRGVRRVFLYNEKIPWGPRYSAVSHPGHGGNPYLTGAAAQVGLRPSGALLRGTRLTPVFRSKGFF